MTALSYPASPLADGVVRLRPWRDDDLACIERAGRDPRIPRGTTVPSTFTPAAGRAFLRRQMSRLVNGEGISHAIAMADSDEAVGLCWLALRPQPGVAGLGFWIVPQARGRGLAERSARLIADWALGDLAMARVEAWVERENIASQRTLLKAGFMHEGVLRNFLLIDGIPVDAMVFSRIADA